MYLNTFPQFVSYSLINDILLVKTDRKEGSNVVGSVGIFFFFPKFPPVIITCTLTYVQNDERKARDSG